MREASQPSRSSVVVCAAACALAGGFLSAPALAGIPVTFTWAVNGNGVWQDGANWDTTTEPNNVSNDDAVILNPVNAASQVVVTVGPNLTRNVRDLTIEDTGVAAKHELVVANNTFLDVGRTVTNNGIITINATANPTRLRAEGNVTLQGTGLLRLAQSGAGTAFISDIGTQTVTNAAGHTIAGTGAIGENSLSVINAGLIDADINGQLLILDPRNDATGITNTGTLRASNGGLLRLTGAFGGAFDNTGGNIGAFGVGSEVQLFNSANITDGVLTTDADGLINVVDGQSGGFTDVTLALNGRMRIGNNSDGFFADTLANQGTITLNPDTTNSDFRIVNDLLLSGGGTIQMNATTGTGGISVINDGGGAGTGTLTNVDNTIRGSGQIGQNGMNLVNQANGLIVADQAGNDLSLDPANTPTGVTNQGTLRATNGGTLTLSGAFSGDVDNTGGTIEATSAGSAVRLVVGVTVTGGTVRGVGGGTIEAVDGQSVAFADVTAVGTVNAGNNTDLFLAGTFTNQGDVHLNPATTNSDLRLAGDTTLTGGGEVFMNPTTGAGGVAVINDGGGGQDILTNVNNTIRGAGAIGSNNMGLVNQAGGTVLADQAGLDLFLDPGATHGFTNQGLFRASNGASLTLSGQFSGGFDNTGGAIEATGANSLVRLVSGAGIAGGTLSGVSGGGVEVSDAQSAGLLDVTTAGAFRVGNNADAFFEGTLTNTGTITLNPATTNSDLRIAGDVTLTGNGTVVLNPTTGTGGISVINDGGGGQDRLTNVNNTIRGVGLIGNNNMALTNEAAGLIDAVGGTLNLDPGAGPVDGDTSVINRGTLRASTGATLFLNGVFSGDFENQAGGVIDVQSGATLDLSGTLTHRQGATITQNGAFNVLSSGNFVNEADDYSPGASPGLVNVASGGVFTNAASGVVTFEINEDDTPGVDFDTIRGDGSFNLDGGIDLVFGNGFTPDFYTDIELILDTAGRNVTGVFDPVFNPIVGPGEAWAISYRANQFGQVDAVVFTRALPGDANLNGLVEQGDLNAVLANWGQTGRGWNRGEMSGNGLVEQGDLNLVLNNWGSALAPDFSGFAVPEPAAALGLGALLLGTRRRSR